MYEPGQALRTNSSGRSTHATVVVGSNNFRTSGSRSSFPFLGLRERTLVPVLKKMREKPTHPNGVGIFRGSDSPKHEWIDFHPLISCRNHREQTGSCYLRSFQSIPCHRRLFPPLELTALGTDSPTDIANTTFLTKATRVF